MFDHRWGKGKGASTLPNGDKLAWITVGGRTSCYVPAVQKKTGHVVSGIKEEAADDSNPDDKPKKSKGNKGKTDDIQEGEVKPNKASKKSPKVEKSEETDAKQKKGKGRKSAAPEMDEEEDVEPPRKKARVKQEVVKEQKAPKAKSAKKTNDAGSVVASGRRRSTRLSNGA